MRKWTYLVAVLLMAGTSTSLLTSCIDNDEPAGIIDLRGAKAELLRAKAAVEQAEAAIKTAQVKWYEAEAEIKNQEAEQEKLKTSWLEAKYQAQKDSIQAQTKKYVEQQNKLYIEALQKSAEANAAYQKALAEIEAALVGVKESAYAERLMGLLSDEPFTYEYQIFNTESKQWETKTIEVKGIKGIITALNNAQSELAELRQAESNMKFSFSKEAKIAAVQSQINIEKGELEGLKENLADLKTIQGVALSDWQTKYEGYETSKKDIEGQKKQLEVQKEEALAGVQGRLDSLEAANEIEKVVAFSIPDEIAMDIFNMHLMSGNQDGNKDKSVNAWAVAGPNADVYTFPNKIELKLNLAEKDAFLVGYSLSVGETTQTIDGLVPKLEEELMTEAEINANKAIVSANQATADRYIKADGTGVYDKAVQAWQKAMTDFHNELNVLIDPADNKREGIIDAFATYNKEIEAADGDATDIKAATDKFKKALNDYVAERTKLDGWLPIDGQDTFDATKDADFAAWCSISGGDADTKRFGAEVKVDMNASDLKDGGLWKAYKEAAAEIGYNTVVNPNPSQNMSASDLKYIEYTYAQYKADKDANLSSIPTLKGCTKTAFEAKYLAETIQKDIDNQDAWQALNKEITAIYDAYMADKAKSDKVEGEILAEKNKISAEWDGKLVALDQKLGGLDAIMTKINGVLKTADASLQDEKYEEVIDWINQQIAYLEGGEVSTQNGTWVSDPIFDINTSKTEGNTTIMGIPAQEALIKSYESLKAAIESGDYKLEEETAMENIAARIKAQDSIVKGWEAILAAANKTKDQLMAALTGESGGTEVPETPEEGGEETPAE
jgi:hypothetical protein